MRPSPTLTSDNAGRAWEFAIHVRDGDCDVSGGGASVAMANGDELIVQK